MRTGIIRVSLAAAAGAASIALCAGEAQAAKPNTMEACKICHTATDDVVRGKMVGVGELKSLSVTVGPLVWVVRFGDDLKVKEGDKVSGPEALKAIPRDREIAVTFTGGEAKPVATQVAVKQPYKVSAEKLATVEQVRELLQRSPEDGTYLLVDSRPGPMFTEGHIPGAVSLPYAVFKEKAASMLPADKGTLVVFYCAGVT